SFVEVEIEGQEKTAIKLEVRPRNPLAQFAPSAAVRAEAVEEAVEKVPETEEIVSAPIPEAEPTPMPEVEPTPEPELEMEFERPDEGEGVEETEPPPAPF
ncbi:MAG: hypothetical protein ACE5LQ_01370, partial [Candidatus Bipolaricaulia bacterium]